MTDIQQPAESEIITPSKMEDSRGAFDKVMEQHGVKDEPNPAEVAPDTKQPEKVPTAPAKTAADTKPPEQKIPESLITGKPPEKTAAPEDELSKLLTEEPKGHLNHERFKALQKGSNEAIAKRDAELVTLKAELAKHTNGNGKLPEEAQKRIDAYEAKLKELDTELKRTAYERHPEFKARFTAREEGVKSQLSDIAKQMGVDGDIIDSALASTFRRRDDLINSLDITDTSKAALQTLMLEHDKIQKEKGAALERSGEELEQHMQQQQEQQRKHEERVRAEEDKVFGEVLEEARKTYAGFQKIDGDDAWNKRVEANEERAKLYFNGGLPLPEMARIAVAGLNASVLSEINTSLRTRLNAEIEKNQKLTSSSPGSGGAAPALRPDGTKLTAEERAMATFDSVTQAASNGGFANNGQYGQL